MNITFYLHDEKDPIALAKMLVGLGKKYRFVSWKEVYDYYYNHKTLHNTCHITIDDGWLSTYDTIYPVLKRLDIPASIFVSPKIVQSGDNFWYYEIKDCDENLLKDLLVQEGYFSKGIEEYPLELILKEMEIDDMMSIIRRYRDIHHLPKRDRGFMNLEELKELDKSGLIEIGAHTMMHPILALENEQRSGSEIKDSIVGLSAILGKEINIFAYPNGLYGLDFGKREMDMVKACGIKLAFSVDPGEYSMKGSPYNIPRVGSISRLRLGKLGLIIPSLHDQWKPRKRIKLLKLK